MSWGVENDENKLSTRKISDSSRNCYCISSRPISFTPSKITTYIRSFLNKVGSVIIISCSAMTMPDGELSEALFVLQTHLLPQYLSTRLSWTMSCNGFGLDVGMNDSPNGCLCNTIWTFRMQLMSMTMSSEGKWCLWAGEVADLVSLETDCSNRSWTTQWRSNGQNDQEVIFSSHTQCATFIDTDRPDCFDVPFFGFQQCARGQCGWNERRSFPLSLWTLRVAS